MADLGYYDDKLLKDQQQPGTQTAAAGVGTPQVGTGTSGVVSGGNSNSVSTAGVGAGGTGGWTNIQAYLGANKGDTGSAKNLEEKTGNLYNQENTNLNTQASTVSNQAQSEANKIKDAKDNSKTWVNQAANAYSWDGQHGDAYRDNVNKLQTARTSTYGGPNNFSYGTSADFQRANTALNDDKSFNSYMGDIYKQKAGGQLNSGQLALQNQLDVNNQALADTRANMLKQYAGFGDVVNNKVTETDAAIKKAREDFGNNQSSLNSHLQNLGSEYETAQNQAEADARAAYNTDYTTGKSGKQAAGLNEYEDFNSGSSIFENARTAKENRSSLISSGIFGDNLTWEQLERERGVGPLKDFSTDGGYGTASGIRDINNRIANERTQNAGALDNFYSTQTEKYKNTGDSEKKNWNTIMDILGRTDKKQQGFNVRGV